MLISAAWINRAYPDYIKDYCLHSVIHYLLLELFHFLTSSSPQAVEFLYHKGFPTALGHVQSGNIFVVDDVCKLGGYENTLLGYKTRIYRLCKDHMDHFDTILFGKFNYYRVH